MKKLILPILFTFFLASCSGISEQSKPQEKSAEIQQISLGKYEVPNGKEYDLVQSGTGFFFKKTDGNLSEVYTSTGEVQKFLTEKNPRIETEYVNSLGKKYKISNYKGISVLSPEGVKIDKSFGNQEEAIAYLKSIEPPTCEITVKSFIPKADEAYSSLNKEYQADVKKFSGKNRIVTFKTLGECKGGKLGFDGNKLSRNNSIIPGINGNKYGFGDSVATILSSAASQGGGVGFGEGYDGDNPGEAPIGAPKIERITDNVNGLEGSIMMIEFKKETTLQMSIGGVMFLVSTTKDSLESVKNEFQFIAKNLSTYAETPKFSWDIKPVLGDYNNSIYFIGTPSDGDIDKGYKEGCIIGRKNGIEKMLCPVGGEINFGDCERSILECEYKGFSNNSLIIDVYPFNYGMNLSSKDSQKRKTYLVNVSSGKVTLKK